MDLGSLLTCNFNNRRKDMPIEIIEHPAQKLPMVTNQTFQEWADFVQNRNVRPIQYGNGTPIELTDGLEYVFLMMGMQRELSAEEFAGLMPYILNGIKQAEKDKVIPVDVVQQIATAFTIPQCPQVPDKFADEIEADAVLKTYLYGHTTFRVLKEEPPDQHEEEEEYSIVNQPDPVEEAEDDHADFDSD